MLSPLPAIRPIGLTAGDQLPIIIQIRETDTNSRSEADRAAAMDDVPSGLRAAMVAGPPGDATRGPAGPGPPIGPPGLTTRSGPAGDSNRAPADLGPGSRVDFRIRPIGAEGASAA